MEFPFDRIEYMRQFDNKKVKDLCDELGIKKHFSTHHHPPANDRVEVINKNYKRPFYMAYGAEKLSLVEVGLLTPRRLHFDEISNGALRMCELIFLEEWKMT